MFRFHKLDILVIDAGVLKSEPETDRSQSPALINLLCCNGFFLVTSFLVLHQHHGGIEPYESV